MPSSGTRVQFLDPVTNTILSSSPLSPPVIPRTPSPTFSGSSFSSPPPLTPISLPYHLPSSPVDTNNYRVHPSIAYSGQTPPLYYDIRSAPSQLILTASPFSTSSSLSGSIVRHASSPVSLGFEPALLAEPATYPALNSLTLISDFLPWSIHVEASLNTGVTIYDILQTLHIVLRIPIAPCEWSSLDQPSRTLIAATFYQRVDAVHGRSASERQKRKGVRRIDFLAGRTKLFGIRPVADKPAVFFTSWSA